MILILIQNLFNNKNNKYITIMLIKLQIIYNKILIKDNSDIIL